MWPVLAGEKDTHRNIAVSALKDWRFVWDGRYKLVEQEGEESRLFDLEVDPGETRDLAGENERETDRLRVILEEEVGQSQ